MRHFLALLGTAVLSVSVAHAADMPVKAPIAVPMYNWSGWYIGADAGWQQSPIDLSADSGPLTFSPRHSSFAYGGFAGYQHQFSQLVLGIEGGYTAATGEASLGSTPSVFIFFPGGIGTAQANLKGIWTIGGRAGWAMGNWMPYFTGGYASGSFGFAAQSLDSTTTEQATAHPAGAYFGGGIDWMAWRNVVAGGDLIVGLEYRHYDFGSTTVFSAIPGFTENITFKTSSDVVMARASIKF